MTYGMTTDGFNRKRLLDIKADIETRLKVVFGDNIDLSAQSVFGQFVGIVGEAIADQWESQENVYNSQYPNTASGVQLSNGVKLNGLTRQAAEKSTVTATLSGTNGTLIPAGSKASTSDTGSVFVTLSDATIVAGTASVSMESEEYGVIEAAIGTLTVIDTPVYGWTGITNAAAATVGRDEETDAELRIRQAESTLAAGQNNADSLYGQLRNVSGVVDALVVENKTDAVDSYGIPAHSFECFVKGGDSADIGQVIWNNTPQGITSHGDETETIVDSQGFDQDVYYTIPSDVDIYIEMDITTSSDFPATGSDDIKADVVSYGEENFLISDDVIYSQLFLPIHETPGVLSVDLKIGTSPSPSGTANISINLDEISAWDVSRITINIV